mmetsp:Transcript_23367/g.37634  ORF Transcript_23367/g.37634 Transcript_23367/m.37634 type:complete len:147 (-) Transcript_23367:155-595(-)
MEWMFVPKSPVFILFYGLVFFLSAGCIILEIALRVHRCCTTCAAARHGQRVSGVEPHQQPTFIVDVVNLQEITGRYRSGDEDDNELCCICLETLKQGDELRLLRCLHCFHQTCIEKWISNCRRADCPLCKRVVFENLARPNVIVVL